LSNPAKRAPGPDTSEQTKPRLQPIKKTKAQPQAPEIAMDERAYDGSHDQFLTAIPTGGPIILGRVRLPIRTDSELSSVKSDYEATDISDECELAFYFILS